MEKTVFKNKYALVKQLTRKGKKDYTIVKVRPSVVIVALTNDNGVLFVRQYREALKKETLELPAGLKDKGSETVIQTAKRELLEETGYASKDWIFLGKFNCAPNVLGTAVPVVLALNAVKKPQRKLEEQPEHPTEIHSFAKIGELIRTEKLTDAVSIAAIYKTRVYLKI